VADLPEGLPSLKVLVELARSPGAIRAEVDALLAGLSQPRPAEHSPREHADLLLSVIDDERIAEFTGSDGRSVRGAAVQALLALGYPYALEVSPEVLSAESSAELPPRSLLSTSKGRWGFGLVAFVGVMQLLGGLYVAVSRESGERALLVLAYVSAISFIPATLMVLGHNLQKRVLTGVGIVGLILCSLFLMTLGVLLLLKSAPIGVAPLLAGGALLAGTMLMGSEP
jgi:hypothetical protein